MNDTTPVTEKLHERDAKLITDLKTAIDHTTRTIRDLEDGQGGLILDVKKQRMVADAPTGDLFVAVGVPAGEGRTKISFMFAPLAPAEVRMEFDPARHQAQLDAIKRGFYAEPVGTHLTNVRFVTKREFEALLIPILKSILETTKHTYARFTKAD